MNKVEIAKTILAQLGGRRFTAMTGAKYFTAIESGLAFSLPARFAKRGINSIRVNLDASDTYTLECFKVKDVEFLKIDSMSGLYADDLGAAFTRMTGLDITL